MHSERCVGNCSVSVSFIALFIVSTVPSHFLKEHLLNHVVKNHVDEYFLSSGRSVRLLAEGRLVNLAAAEGHPATVMDMSFANQALCAAFICSKKVSLENRVHPVPEEIDRQIARMKLSAMKIHIDTLTAEQQEYLCSWQEGT